VSDRELLTECLEALTHDAAQRTFAGGVRMSQLAIKLRTHLAAPRPEPEKERAEIERLQNLLYDQIGKVTALRATEQMRKQIAELKHAENERLRGLLAEAQKAVWMNYDNDLLDRIEAALKEVPR